MTSTQDSSRAETIIKRVARSRFGKGLRVTPFFEHGHWWLNVEDTSRDISEAYSTWNVVDAVPGIDGTGIDFEEL